MALNKFRPNLRLAGLGVAAAFVGMALAGATPAEARTYVSVGIGLPYYAAPVYAPPPVVYYAPPPVYYAPAPVYYGPAPVAVYGGWGYRHHWRHW
jgi:hypothetical protein